MINSLRYYYAAPIDRFCVQSVDEVYGQIARQSSFDVTDGQKRAWENEIILLQHVLRSYQGQVLFEYAIPRLGKRADVIVLINGVVYCLEFKDGEADFLRQDIEQVWDYALDLSYFHEASHRLTIIPILVATAAQGRSKEVHQSLYNPNVIDPLQTNAALMEELLMELNSRFSCDVEMSDWADARYSPTPTIIQAASALYLDHSVADITRTEASGKSLQDTTHCVLNILQKTKQRGEKAICFVTGVPGAGKTLVGLNVAIEQFKQNENKSSDEDRDLAVYLSGNGPLVEVLTEALARDKKEREEQLHPGVRYSITKAREAVKSFIQSIHHYRDFALEIVKRPIVGNCVEVDPNKRHKSNKWIVEHVAIFDEAQRCWDQPHLSAWLNRKKGISDFPMSEAEFLIWSLNLRTDWALIVCLVGGGQEINTGEAGIAEWIKAVRTRFPDWNIYISNQLTDKEYAEGQVNDYLASVEKKQTFTNLHLSVPQRSFRAENLSAFVHALLDCEPAKAKEQLKQLQAINEETHRENFPILLTRDLDKAKKLLHQMAQGSERYGLLVSSQAYRLKPLAIDVRCKPDTVHWFLDDASDIRSSLFLEDAASEFDVQGLELDYTCLIWDGDMRYHNGSWQHYSFTSSRWVNINKPERQAYQLNAYRVLLTRARQGMIICVPNGNAQTTFNGTPEDPTRLPIYYDGTYNYLKSIGLKEI